MAQPASRSDFVEYCLRRLGKGVIEINVTPEQIDDRIDEALVFYADFHFDGTDRMFYKYALQQADIDNKYIQLPENIIGAVNLFPIGGGIGSNNMFNIRYQIALNDLYTLTSVSMVPYYMAMSHLQLLEELLVGKQPFRYNRNNNKFWIDMDWSLVVPGMFIVIEAYQVVDPDTYTAIWKDRFMIRYATCLIKEQWGSNLTKFTGMQMPGGMQFNGDRILSDAQREKRELEDEMINTWSALDTQMIA